jgi:hypothetical protein
VTRQSPLQAPAGTLAVIRFEDKTVKVVGTRQSVTPVVLLKPLPLIVTVPPIGPLVGEKELIVGAAAAALIAACGRSAENPSSASARPRIDSNQRW